MKNCLIPFVFLLFTVSSCERRDPYVYQYENNPQFTKGYVDFWGSFYAGYDISNNVSSLSAFTDSLFSAVTDPLLVKDDYLHGVGQYLFLEDIFIPPFDTLFPPYVYVVSDSGAAFTIAPGKAYKDKKDDDVLKDVGACIYFVEKIESNSIRKFIIGGTMTVTQLELYTDFDFKFILDDKDSTQLEGRLHIKDLAYYDRSVFAPMNDNQRLRLKKVNAFTPEKFKTNP